MTKQLIPALTLYNGSIPGLDEDPADLASSYAVNGADALIVLDLSDDDASHDRDVAAFEKICKASDIPVEICRNDLHELPVGTFALLI